MRRYLNIGIKVINKYFLSRLNPNYKLNYKNKGVINFIDIGSTGGLPEPWRSNARFVKFLLNFEPNDTPTLGNNSLTYNTAVWEIEDTLPFYIYKGFNATGSSLFKQNFTYVKDNYDILKNCGPKYLAESWYERSTLVKTTEIKCQPLDNIIRDKFSKMDFHFIKSDAQGAEYNILKGSKYLLTNSCIGLHLELFTIPLYEGIVLLEEVQDFLSHLGFRLIKMFPAHGTFDSQHDCLFLKESGDPALLSIIRNIYGIRENIK